MTISGLACPRCKYRFNYEFIPGASATSVRLGHKRYMRCPKCGRWAVFDLSKNRVSGLPTYSDSKAFARYAPLLIAPLFAWAVFLVLISNSLIGYGTAAILAVSIIPAVLLATIPVLFVMKKARPVRINR
ncbi:hypothetical protein M1567_02060 [Candidatus Marsarchaeota archaeon]|jgi:hypothetical protein|nr:hypothetical protein [Candidatus Marsarchaeota archaeon]